MPLPSTTKPMTFTVYFFSFVLPFAVRSLRVALGYAGSGNTDGNRTTTFAYARGGEIW